MPLDRSATVVRSPFVSHRGEAPRTLLLDAEDAIRVRVLRRPDDDPALRDVLHAVVSSSYAYRPEVEALGDPLEAVAEGRTLWQSAENLDWTILVEGIDRTISHQVVRTRIGVTFAQQCTGERDCRHDDVLIPRAYARPGFGARLDDFVAGALDAKRRYASDVDAWISTHEARRGLPHASATFLLARWSLSSLAPWYAKRRDSLTQDWLMFRLAEAVRAAVVEASPWVRSAFRTTDPSASLYARAAAHGGVAFLFSPSGSEQDRAPWHPDSFPHGAASHWEVSSGPKIAPRLYVGRDLVAVGVEAVREALAEVDPSGVERVR